MIYIAFPRKNRDVSTGIILVLVHLNAYMYPRSRLCFEMKQIPQLLTCVEVKNSYVNFILVHLNAYTALFNLKC
jgi:hypothetical protein